MVSTLSAKSVSFARCGDVERNIKQSNIVCDCIFTKNYEISMLWLHFVVNCIFHLMFEHCIINISKLFTSCVIYIT